MPEGSPAPGCGGKRTKSTAESCRRRENLMKNQKPQKNLRKELLMREMKWRKEAESLENAARSACEGSAVVSEKSKAKAFDALLMTLNHRIMMDDAPDSVMVAGDSGKLPDGSHIRGNVSHAGRISALSLQNLAVSFAAFASAGADRKKDERREFFIREWTREDGSVGPYRDYVLCWYQSAWKPCELRALYRKRLFRIIGISPDRLLTKDRVKVQEGTPGKED